MLQLKFDTVAAEAAIENMLQNVSRVPETEMPHEFLAWQADDLGRRQPRIDQQTEKAVMTIIIDRQVQRVKQLKKRGRKIAVRDRPILRPELFTRLCEKMSDMLVRTLTWR